MSLPLIETRAVSRRFASRPDLVERLLQRAGVVGPTPVVHALDGISLQVHAGEFVGVVGESGCGKSTLGRLLAGILEPSSGQVLVEGTDPASLGDEARRRLMLKVQMIFQDPYASLNPRMRVRDIVGEAPWVHGLCRRDEVDDYVSRMLERVGLSGDFLHRFPHQFSGGQRQRVGIARALAVNPGIIVCDESVAALDVSIQAQVLNLFMDLRRDTGSAWVFISHDLGVVEHVCDRVVVMYLGRVVESAATEALFGEPLHPYTRALLDDLPTLSRRKRQFRPLQGEVPSPLAPPPGCHFHPRCPLAGPRCQRERPALRDSGQGHAVACHLHDGGVA